MSKERWVCVSLNCFHRDSYYVRGQSYTPNAAELADEKKIPRHFKKLAAGEELPPFEDPFRPKTVEDSHRPKGIPVAGAGSAAAIENLQVPVGVPQRK